MKTVIPVAGIGTKLRPHTHTQPKALVPVAGKPILAHIVDSLIEAGQRDFVFIIGYLGDKIESFITERYPSIRATFVVQEPREGTGQALWLARDEVDSEEQMLVVLGDTIVDFDVESVIRSGCHGVGVKKVDDPRNFGVAEINEEGMVTRLHEKPNIPKSNMALVGVYYFHRAGDIMETLDAIIGAGERMRDEYNLTDALSRMVSKGAKVRAFQVGNWYDCGNKNSLLETNAVLLKRTVPSPQGFAFNNTIIIPPVSIAPGCDISNSIIGPNVSIGERTIIKSSIISDSIIGSFSQLETAVLNQSVVGSDSYLKGLSQSLNIGDSTEIDFS
ncbi:MAG: sugar nucleotidyltransferase [Bacteroidota bacterium]|jgi:glucose-1-phosphate thymidylyltransferase